MPAAIDELFLAVRDAGLPVRHSRELMAFGQDESLFFLASAKQSRQQRLRERFGGQGIRRVLIGANLNGFDYRRAGTTVEYLDKGFFSDSDEASRARKREHLAGALVIVNNNDVGHNQGMPAFADFYRRCDQTVFAAWDWDNHHWLDCSTFLAAHSDVYAPAHHENLYLLSRYNASITGPVYCASVQWPRALLAESLPQMMTTPRSSEPLGKHIPYAPFVFRNRVISTLAQRYASIGFSDRTFHVRTPQERLAEWTAHKSHWIVPVLNDVPIRIFDALITGGIPIVPDSLRALAPVREIGREHIVFYGPQDIIEPAAVVARACQLFDDGGADALVARHRLALAQHHGQNRIDEIVAQVEALGLA